ncbi:MAG: AAA family ATPase [Planctomycetes bacterium]|nr:AAA family ATPase [Planctomycetota bacterium]
MDGTASGIVADRRQVRLRNDALEVDIVSLSKRLRGKVGELESSVLESCAESFRGELLEGLELDDCFAYGQWLEAARERARNLHVSVLSALTSRHFEDPARGLAHARTWVSVDPLDSEAHARLIGWLGRVGRPDDARRAVAECRALFLRELGREPGPAVERAIRSLDTAPRSSTPSSDTPAPDPDTTPRDVGLFGRTEECIALEQLLDSSSATLWIEGEPGIGKSRLLGEAVRRAASRGFHTVYAKAYEAERARPFALFSEMLEDGAEPDRERLYETLLQRLLFGAGAAPTLLALDDLQWIDESSAALVSWIARRGSGTIFIVASARSGELEDNAAAQSLFRVLEREGLVRQLILQPLASVDIRALVRSINPSVDASAVVESCGGNPMFASELARGGTESGKRLNRCISERLSRLRGRERELLRVGAALGRSFSLELAYEVTGLRTGEIAQAVERLERQGVLRTRDADEIDFAHDLLRQAVYDELSVPTRKLLHRRIARTLAASVDSRVDTAPLLARQAQLAGEHDLAAEAFAASGERSIRLHAPEEAVEFARRGLRHAVLLEAPRQRQVRVRLLAVKVHAGLGRREAERLYEEILALAEASAGLGEHATVRTAEYLLSVLDEESGRFDRAQEHTIAALRAGRSAAPDTQVRALANSGRCLAQLGRELDRAEGLLSEAEQAEAPLSAAVDIAWGRGLIAWHRGDLGQAAAWLNAASSRASEFENHWAHFECLSRLVLVEVEAGEAGRARARADDLRAAASQLAGGSEQALTEAVLELAAYADRDSSDATSFESALVALRELDNKAALSLVLNVAADVDLRRGRKDTARRWAEDAGRAALVVGRQRQLDRANQLLNDIGNE